MQWFIIVSATGKCVFECLLCPRTQVQDEEDALEYQRVRRIVAQLLSRFAQPAAAAVTAYHTGASRLDDDSVFHVEEDQQQQPQQQLHHGYRYYYESPTAAANFKTQESVPRNMPFL